MNWFITINEVVSGPFDTDEVLEMQNEAGFNSSIAFVWGANLSFWLQYSKWIQSHQTIISHNSGTKTKIQSWYYAPNSQSKPIGPFDKLTLVEKIADLPQKDKILIWTKGMDAWASVFEFSDMLDELNISRRRHPRAKIEGSVILKGEDGQSHIGNVSMISIGGCGIDNIAGLKIGGKYSIEIKSPSLFNNITAEAKIVVQSDNDSYGVRFDKIHTESESTIISYIKGLENKKAA